MGYAPIEDYGVIGDLCTVALVGSDASIDFMCFPYFDSPSIFAALLDDRRGGRFRIAPTLDDATRKQIYLPDSNILVSRFLSDDGIAEVSDFMPIESGPQTHELVRRAKTVHGEVHFEMLCEPRFDYGRGTHRVSQQDGVVLFEPKGKGQPPLRLRSEVPVEIRDGAAVANFTLQAGETAAFVLEHASGESRSADPGFVAESFKRTLNWWRRWISRSTYTGRWREMVNRSALTLKMLTTIENGSIVAAPTFGLPETLGGGRNWDYRYTWIRDASFTLYALIRLGYTEESACFMRWLEARCEELNPDGSLQTMYGIDGRHDLEEVILSHLNGYCDSRPVRIGNAAHRQLQLDIYGELMDAVYLYDKYGDPIVYDLWRNLVRLMGWLCKNWQRPDEGIWEVRGGHHEFLYSRLLSWVAVDRAMRLSTKRGLPAPLDEWRRVRDTIYEEIQTNFWNAKRGAYVQTKGSDVLDAACLLMPLVKFVSPKDPRWISTLAAVESELVEDSLVFRYRVGNSVPDGLEGDEGTFSMCSFWYIECLSRMGDLRKARFMFDKMLGYASHLGLYGEELGTRGQHLGNFPQAFTHVALISAAYDLDRRLSSAHIE
jgi:GH15 family glucan-1,4-alpha-glucosidase